MTLLCHLRDCGLNTTHTESAKGDHPLTCFDAGTLRDWRSDGHRGHTRYMAGYVQPRVKDAALFGGIDESDMPALLGYCYLRTLRPGDAVYRTGDLPAAIYLVLSGRVELRLESPFGQVVKESLALGSSFGDVALLGVQPHSDAAFCVEAGEVLALSVQAFAQLNRDNPALFTHLLLNLSRDVSRRLMRHDQDYTEWVGARSSIS
ncbi:cyclic nucleotide-binding domain-containing protein [Simiduia agarivorans]|uniref:CarD family transcriptional regulator n=1 Tax=Simiduia agarivorans (strain DSM 21679 / JCM 13881 / BCRC 17597 / SA1) TaxID=1117647 RepID=K4KRH6_SIMAS|nr:cyclic nucleotide-binding domain-containing protein [Simiduia agarivorans]AFV00896.1 CarD family transcriptional regulator [Simiduia agarivorans SA1 = DSM 21679]